jgi:hypothetical protein
MTSLLGWNSDSKNIDNSMTNTPLLNIGVETAGVDSHVPVSDKLDISSPVNSGKIQSKKTLSTINDQNCEDDGSDYVLDSEHSDGGSDTSPRCTGNTYTKHIVNKVAQKIPKRHVSKSDKSLTKVSSTGNLRVYHKTDLKNKIGAVEHRLLILEQRLETMEKKCGIVFNAKPDYSVPTIIKFVGGCLLLLHLGRFI